MENFNEDYLQHHGTKGMKWGVRRYQNKDGSLTPAGRKHYSKEMDKLKAEEQKLKAEKKVLDNKKKTQAKFDKLDAKKAKLEADKKALKEEQKKFKKGEKPEPEKHKETVEEKRERLLKSSNAEELYKNKDLLTTAEINERLDRINTEQRLANVAASTKTTGKQRINNAIDTFKTIDNVYTTVSKSGLGGLVKKKLGIGDKESSGFDLDKAYKNMYTMSDEQAKKVASRVDNMEKLEKFYNRVKGKDQQTSNDKKSNDKKPDDKKSNEGKTEEKKNKNQETESNKQTSNKKTEEPKTERYEATADDIIGEGTSRSRYNDSSNDSSSRRSSDYYNPIDSYGEWVNETPVSSVPAVRRDSGQSAIAGLIETTLNSEAARAGRLLLEEAIK